MKTITLKLKVGWQLLFCWLGENFSFGGLTAYKTARSLFDNCFDNPFNFRRWCCLFFRFWCFLFFSLGKSLCWFWYCLRCLFRCCLGYCFWFCFRFSRSGWYILGWFHCVLCNYFFHSALNWSSSSNFGFLKVCVWLYCSSFYC